MDNWGQTVESAYSGAAELYSQVYSDCLDWQIEERQHFAELVRETDFLSILDVGCGPGRDLAIFADMGLRPVGLDFSDDMLELAKKSSQPLVKADMRKPLPFADSSFSGVWACSIIPNIPHGEFSEWLGEISRILRPGGILFISARNGRVGNIVVPYLDDMETCRVHYSLEQLRGAIDDQDFQIISAENVLQDSKEYQVVFARRVYE